MAMNELYSMLAAQRGGIETADTRLSDDGRHLLVRRFDRDAAGNRLAFEDMASLMGLPSSAKFSGSVERIIKTLAAFCEGPLRASAPERFFRQYALAMMLRNGDAHLKNFGVLYSPQGGGNDVRLAPCYDMVTMAAYAPSRRPARPMIFRPSCGATRSGGSNLGILCNWDRSAGSSTWIESWRPSPRASMRRQEPWRMPYGITRTIMRREPKCCGCGVMVFNRRACCASTPFPHWNRRPVRFGQASEPSAFASRGAGGI